MLKYNHKTWSDRQVEAFDLCREGLVGEKP